jgi:hypothetical protein
MQLSTKGFSRFRIFTASSVEVFSFPSAAFVVILDFLSIPTFVLSNLFLQEEGILGRRKTAGNEHNTPNEHHQQ